MVRLIYIFFGRDPWLYQYWPGGIMAFVVLCPETPEGSTGSDSGFKASQKTGQRLKASSDRLGASHLCFCGRDVWLYQYWPGGFMLFVVLCPGTPEGSSGSGSGFKASQKTGQRLKSLIRQTGRSRESHLRPLVYKT